MIEAAHYSASGAKHKSAFELPADGRIASTWDELRAPTIADALGELAARCHDRGVIPAPLAPASFWIGSDGAVRFTTAQRVAFALDVSPRAALRSWSAALGASAIDSFSAGFRRGLGLGVVDQRALDELLRAD